MDKFEEYKLLYQRTEKLSERRQTTSQIYLTINTAIFGAVAFLVKDSGLSRWALGLVTLSLFLVGLLACIIWLIILVKAEKFLDWQYDRLRDMEKDIPTHFKIFSKENEAFFEPSRGKKKFSFSLQEAWLPIVLMILYSLYSVGIILGIIQGKL
jgi:hypothetical protein